MSPLPTNLPESFVARKAQILADLATPEAAYEDASPKGSLDVQILDLINTINELPGYVTTSSCAGRIAVFVEGKKKTDAATEGHIPQNKGELSLGQKGETRETLAATGGKGGGGKWLYVSHDPYIFESNQGLAATLGLVRKHDSDSASWQGKRLVRFKFEPMILHILTASLEHAQLLLRAGLEAGFRESGAVSLIGSGSTSTPMVAIRSMGLGMESIVGYLDEDDDAVCFVPDSTLLGLITISTERFQENDSRRARFCNGMLNGLSASQGEPMTKQGKDGAVWEDAQARKERMRREGLERSKALKEKLQQNNTTNV